MDKVEHGEFRDNLTRDLQAGIERTINKFKKEDSYWILVYATNLFGDISTKIMRLSQCPPKMLGTICYHVDNKLGQLRRLWVLPLDIPRDPDTIDLESGLEEIAKSVDADILIH